MLRITPRTSAADAKAYFTHGLARQDYYIQGQEIAGQWGGRGAELLGLRGTVDTERYYALCDNLNPVDGGRLTARTKSNRTVGYDFNFHVPKSVSVVYAWTGDDRILEAFRAAVAETMADVEAEARTRVRQRGQDADRVTGNLVWAEFVHLTARPVNGVPDPHLHAHCFTFNATQDPEEGRWKAGQFRPINTAAPYYQEGFLNRLSRRLIAIGYPVEPKEKAFEIVGVPESILRKFSRRTAKVEQRAKELGITDPAAKARLGAATREAKAKDLTWDECRELWADRLGPEGRAIRDAFLGRLSARDRVPFPSSLPVAPAAGIERPNAAELRAIGYAILHCFERASAVDDWRLLTEALRFGAHEVDVGRLRAALADHPDLIRRTVDGRRMVTTLAVLSEERAMVEWVRSGRGSVAPIAIGHAVRDGRLNDEQRAAVRHVLESTDRVTAIRGRAGTGKSTLMREAIDAIRDRGRRVLVMAPGGETARQVLPEGGFPDAITVARLLVDPAAQASARGSVWWVDEAGLLSSRMMAKLCTLAESLDARIVLSGDPDQHKPVERGDAMRILEQYASLSTVRLEKVVRQTGLYRDAVELLSHGRLEEAFRKLNELKAIREIADATERYDTLARDYTEIVASGQTVLVVSPTHAECRLATEAIRKQLRLDGHLKDERVVPCLRHIDFGDAEKSNVRLHRTGWTLELTQNVPGYHKGDRFEVAEVDAERGRLRLRGQDGKEFAFDAARYADRFELFEPNALPVGVGDRVRITMGGRTADGRGRLENTTLHTVAGFTRDGDLRLANGWVVARDYGHVAHGYATTSYSAQSKTVDWVLVAEGSESSLAANREQVYVSITRGRHGIRMYTDTLETVMEAARTARRRLAAMDLTRVPDRPADEREVEDRPASPTPPSASKVKRIREYLPEPDEPERERDGPDMDL